MNITNLNSNISDNKIEINTLKFQLDSLKKLLEENNLSSILKELMEAQEKSAYFQGQYHKVSFYSVFCTFFQFLYFF